MRRQSKSAPPWKFIEKSLRRDLVHNTRVPNQAGTTSFVIIIVVAVDAVVGKKCF